MKYSKIATIEPGMMFETKDGVMVKTTRATVPRSFPQRLSPRGCVD